MQHSVGLFSVMSDENAVLPQSSTNIKQQLSGSSSSSGLFDATPQKQQNILSSNTVKSSRKALVDLSNGQVNNRNASILSTPKVNGKGRMGSNLILQTTNKLTKTAPQGTQFIIKQQHDKIKNNENIISVNKNIFKKSVSSDCSSTSKGCLKQQDDGKVKIEASFSKVNSTMPDTYSTDEMLCSRVALGEADIAEDVYDAVMRAAGHISHTLVPTTGKNKTKKLANKHTSIETNE